jgi:hypothetical protein
LAYIRMHWEVRLVAYIDDLLLLHQDPSYLLLATQQIAVYLQSLGWTLSLGKREFTPKQEIVFLGWRWDFRSLSPDDPRDERIPALHVEAVDKKGGCGREGELQEAWLLDGMPKLPSSPDAARLSVLTHVAFGVGGDGEVGGMTGV